MKGEKRGGAAKVVWVMRKMVWVPMGKRMEGAVGMACEIHLPGN